MIPITEIYGRKASNGQINWITAIAMSAFHIGAVAAFFFIDWGAIAMMFFLWWVAGSLGIGMGYHRLLTHRGYKTPKWVEYFLTLCGTLALEGGPIFWVATHRIHHQHSDHEGDPHTPREGTYWAHMGWIMTGQAMHHDTQVLRRYVPDLAKDRFHVAMTEWHWVPQVVLGLGLLADPIPLRVGLLARLGEDLLGVGLRLADQLPVLLEEFARFLAGAVGLLDRLANALAPVVDRLLDRAEGEPLQHEEGDQEADDRPDHQPRCDLDQGVGAE